MDAMRLLRYGTRLGRSSCDQQFDVKGALVKIRDEHLELLKGQA